MSESVFDKIMIYLAKIGADLVSFQGDDIKNLEDLSYDGIIHVDKIDWDDKKELMKLYPEEMRYSELSNIYYQQRDFEKSERIHPTHSIKQMIKDKVHPFENWEEKEEE